MTAAAAEAWGGRPSQVVEWRPSPGGAGASLPLPALPALPRAKVRNLREPLALSLPVTGPIRPGRCPRTLPETREWP